jgi:hypothetical protein
MAISEQQRQKKLAKKKQKRAAAVKKSPVMSTSKAKPYAEFPIYECLIPTNLFIDGIGELVVTRRLPNGYIAMSAFVIDVFCLGVKDAMFRVLPEGDYVQGIRARMSEVNGRSFEELTPGCAKKLLDGLVDYAKGLGFAPHADYNNAKDLLAAPDADEACPVQYVYGKDGKPFYMNGPYESPAAIQRIIRTLTESCGEGGFDTLVGLSEGDDYDDD